MKESSLSGARYCDERESPSARLGITGPLLQRKRFIKFILVGRVPSVWGGARGKTLLFVQYLPQERTKCGIVFKGLDRGVLAQPVWFR